MRPFAFVVFVSLLTLLPGPVRAADKSPFIAGADVSMLYELERAGAVYRDSAGNPSDAIRVLHDNGCNLFRLRLFVSPSTDFKSTWGATQDLQQVRELGKRVKATGAKFLLDLHYSDTWADPAKQKMPRDWEGLTLEQLERKVTDYATQTIKDLQASAAAPDMVQVGNEITGGMLFPEGKVLDAPKDVELRQWQRLVRLFNAGALGVRNATPAGGKPIPVMIHISGGGKPGLPKWYFGKLDAAGTAHFDVVGLSFYPAWGDSIDALKQNIKDVVDRYGKDVYIAETSYPWRPMPEMEKHKSAMTWPATPDGQKQFLADLTAVLRDVPDGHGAGFIWWYPEAVPTKDRFIWRDGAEALFDKDGNPLPALKALGEFGR